MARRKRPHGRRSHKRARELYRLSDEELGRWLANLHRTLLEGAACRAVGIDALYSGRNAMAEPPESRSAREVIERLIADYFRAALRYDRGAPEYLAIWLALKEDYEHAGQAFRQSSGLRRVQTEQAQAKGGHKGRQTIRQTKRLRETAWERIGRTIRQGERERRQTNKALAKAIWNDCPRDLRAAVSTITQAVPRLGLDRRKWDREHPLRPARAAVWPRTIKTFATRKRSNFGHFQFGKNKSVSR